MNEQKPKNYYSLNLTEGRIFLIFITVLIVITVIVFSIALLISNSNKKGNDTVVSESEELKITESDNPVNDNYTYYNLNNDQKEDTFLAENKEPMKEENNIQNAETKSQNNSNSDAIQNEFHVQVKEKEDDIVKLDNNNVLRSSKYTDNNETQDAAPVKNTPKVTKVTPKKETVVVKKSTNSKKIEIRFTVQVGSYLDKKAAEEISLFYKIQGYPAYITEKISGDKKFYRLRVGPFKAKEDAEKYLLSLKSTKYGKDSSIWEVYL